MLRLRCVVRVGSLAGRREGSVIYRTLVNCDDYGVPFRCSWHRCLQNVERDCYFCDHHLGKKYSVEIRQSNIAAAGLGLFATRDFAKGERVVHYGGEVISLEELHNRYGWMKDNTGEFLQITAPYTIGIADSDNSRDAIRIRGAGAYVNDPRGTRFEENVTLDDTHLHTTRPVKAGEEFFAVYGDEYWGSATPAHMSHVTEVDVPLDDMGMRDRKRRRFSAYYE